MCELRIEIETAQQRMAFTALILTKLSVDSYGIILYRILLNLKINTEKVS